MFLNIHIARKWLQKMKNLKNPFLDSGRESKEWFPNGPLVLVKTFLIYVDLGNLRPSAPIHVDSRWASKNGILCNKSVFFLHCS